MQEWRNKHEQWCKFWQLVQLEPGTPGDWKQETDVVKRIATPASQQANGAGGQHSTSGIQPAALAADQIEIIG